MSGGEDIRAEIIYIKDSDAEGGAANETNLELKLRVDHMSLLQTSPSASDQAENTPKHLVAQTMETAVGKHRVMSPQQCHDTACGEEVSSGFVANRVATLQDRSPTNSYTDLFPTPASSRESILSDGWDKDKSWSNMQLSALTSPVSFSRTVSPCSSVRSGFFSPAVVRVKRHCLAPGSSLVQMPQSCFSSCESLFSSVCPQSPPPRHRPPLTRLSLLTAILRKGRLPVLSSALQRPYSPCWPMNPVTLSSCNACSAASSVASIPLEFFSRFPPTATESQDHSHLPMEPYKCTTAPRPQERQQTAAIPCSEQVHLDSRPPWGRVTSPPLQSCSRPIKNTTLPQNAPQLCCSPVSKSVSPPAAKHQEISDSAPVKNIQHSSICSSKLKTPECEASNTQRLLEGPAVEIALPKIICPSPKPLDEQEPSAPRKQRHHSNSTLSNLRSLSQQLRSLPSLTGSHSITVSDRQASFHPLLQNTADPPETTPQLHCLSPPRYTPIIFPGWPSPSCSPTPDRFLLTPSPAPPIRDLTPSPSLSMRSTPSPRPGSGISDCSDREGKKRKQHKIKSSYKSLAAIPTNTLLLDQQVIDDQVERSESADPCDTLDTHAEMCSPAELRQKSEELYAVIDEILADSIPDCKTSPLPQASRASTSSDSVQTKPGVIRPMTAIPRLTVEEEDEFRLPPYRQYATDTISGNRKK
ncbi:muscular LMNA-interacting protein [Genypterus blacodes]|uniref:muscular LMNA-interacting protein n=1 Tax=Genypterus blacodes TaxID=154954 RepID=UPI003F76775D